MLKLNSAIFLSWPRCLLEPTQAGIQGFLGLSTLLLYLSPPSTRPECTTLFYLLTEGAEALQWPLNCGKAVWAASREIEA